MTSTTAPRGIAFGATSCRAALTVGVSPNDGSSTPGMHFAASMSAPWRKNREKLELNLKQTLFEWTQVRPIICRHRVSSHSRCEVPTHGKMSGTRLRLSRVALGSPLRRKKNSQRFLRLKTSHVLGHEKWPITYYFRADYEREVCSCPGADCAQTSPCQLHGTELVSWQRERPLRVFGADGVCHDPDDTHHE